MSHDRIIKDPLFELGEHPFEDEEELGTQVTKLLSLERAVEYEHEYIDLADLPNRSQKRAWINIATSPKTYQLLPAIVGCIGGIITITDIISRASFGLLTGTSIALILEYERKFEQDRLFRTRGDETDVRIKLGELATLEVTVERQKRGAVTLRKHLENLSLLYCQILSITCAFFDHLPDDIALQNTQLTREPHHPVHSNEACIRGLIAAYEEAIENLDTNIAEARQWFADLGSLEMCHHFAGDDVFTLHRHIWSRCKDCLEDFSTRGYLQSTNHQLRLLLDQPSAQTD